MGVRTKNGKAATTYLLPISDLRAVAEKWDSFVRGTGAHSGSLVRADRRSVG